MGIAAKDIADTEAICKKAEAATVTVQKFLAAVKTGLEADNLLFDADMAKLATDAVATNLMDLMETIKSLDAPVVVEQRKLKELYDETKAVENTIHNGPFILFGDWLDLQATICEGMVSLSPDSLGWSAQLQIAGS